MNGFKIGTVADRLINSESRLIGGVVVPPEQNIGLRNNIRSDSRYRERRFWRIRLSAWVVFATDDCDG